MKPKFDLTKIKNDGSETSDVIKGKLGCSLNTVYTYHKLGLIQYKRHDREEGSRHHNNDTINYREEMQKMLKGEAPKTRPLEGLSGHIQGEDRSIIDNVNVYGE
jgi:hypothetical protein